MPTLNIRNLPPEVHAALRVRAARNGRSMEAEARLILTDTVTRSDPDPAAGDRMQRVGAVREELAAYLRRPAGQGIVDELIRERRAEAQHEQGAADGA